MHIRKALGRIADKRNLSLDEMQAVMKQIMTGEADEAQIGAFLMGLRLKGATQDEITAAVMVMRELASGVQVAGEHVVDIVGTGGDGANLFNVSTASSFVVAAAGGRVAKHGNRSVSSSSGSADVLEAAGVALGLEPEQVADCVEQVGVGFMFAPAHHSAMKHAIGPRQSLGVRTLFNILGPMTNPAGVKRLLVGVYKASLCRKVADVLIRLGAEHVLVVHSNDGLDEISASSFTHVAEGLDGAVTEYGIKPAEWGLQEVALDGLEVDGAEQSLALIRQALCGDDDERAERARHVIAMNAGAALYLAGLADNGTDGVALAMQTMRSGAAWAKVEELAAVSSAFGADSD